MSTHDPNGTVDEIYEALVKAAGLYGKAFFAERCTPAEQKKLNSLYKLAIRTVDIRNETKEQIAKKIAEVKPTTGMIPGQVPYTPDELEELNSLVSDAAESDLGELAE